MGRYKKVLCAALVPLWIGGTFACQKAAAPTQRLSPRADNVVVIASSHLWGYLGPCGCSENMRGGMARAAFQVAEARASKVPVLYIDTGDALFARTEYPPLSAPQEKRKAEAIAAAFLQMGLSTKGIGERDKVFGDAFLGGLKLPIQAEGESRTLDAGGRRVAVVSAGHPEQLMELARRARPAADFVLGILHQPLSEAQAWASAGETGVDFLIAAHADGEFDAEENRLVHLETPTAQVESKGRSLLRLDISFGPSAGRFTLLKSAEDKEREVAGLQKRIALLTKQVNEPSLKEEAKAVYRLKIAELVERRQKAAAAPAPAAAGQNALGVRFIPLEATLPELQEIRGVIDAYHRDVSKLNLQWAQAHGQDCPAPGKGEAAFVGSAACEECHAEAFPVWKESKHAVAYDTLQKAGRQYDLDCVRCHVTGPDQPGGVCRVDKVSGRAEVGCESCHGPGSTHVENPSSENVVAHFRAEHCVGCHNPENSPHFDFARYLPEVLGPGHRQRAR